MSNIGSSALAAMTQHGTRTPAALPAGKPEQMFQAGTRNLLDEARNVVENATQQGQQLNPMIYQMLGMDPQYEDHSADLQSAQAEMDAAQKQFDQATQTVNQLRGIPAGKRTPAQRKQLRQLTKGMPQLQQSLERAKDAHGNLATMPKTITGFNRLDPSQIPSNSPFSAANPLYQIQQTEATRAQQAMAGGIAVDPTLVHQYTQAEAQLRAQLAARYGPDYENSSVGQMALQSFNTQRSNAFATWNYNTAQQYATQAYNQAGQQQSLMANLIGLYREPGTYEANMGAQLSNLGGAREAESSQNLANRAAGQGLVTNLTQSNPMGLIGAGVGAAGSLLTSPTVQNAAGSAWNALTGPSSAGSGGWEAAAAGQGGGAAATGVGDVGAGMSSSEFGAGMSSAAGGEVVGNDVAALV
jgi:hypothetical protein